MYPSTRYVMLMTSLPYLGSLFSVRETPLSRFRLEQRLKLLDKADALLLEQIERVVHWERHQHILSDAEVLQQARALIGRFDGDRHNHPGEFRKREYERVSLRLIVQWRLELRTLIAALRRRQQGQSPQIGEDWGYGRWTGHIERYWGEPGFRLDGVYPWIVSAVKLLQQRDTPGLERLILGTIWEQLERARLGHHFDFVAVVIYVLQWNIINRWTRYDRKEVAAQLDTLVSTGLGDFKNLVVSQ